MKYRDIDKELSNPFKSKNWEADIRKVLVEPCDETEDPLGFKAVFYMEKEVELVEKRKSFVVGASFLAQRAYNLTRAGYQAPMTQRAIEMIKETLGTDLPMTDMEHIGRAV
jgi:hypothetical protein